MKALKTIREDFYKGLKAFFEELNIPINYLAEEPAKPTDILSENYNNRNHGHQLMNDVYFLGIVNDETFEEKDTFQSGEQFKNAIKKDYDGIVLLGITLKERENGLLPTRSQLADITRAFNREFKYTPVTIVFKYGDYISFANSERLRYKQEWREGEKAGKVTILRDIKTEGTHSGHLRILQRLEIKRSGAKAITSYTDLYKYWQEVLSVSVLNKSFYEELSNWYFWAIKSVRFPGEPVKEANEKDADFLEKTKAHRAQNVIRLITRLMFAWFIKEKHLINAQLFDEPELKEIVDLGKKNSSNYYKAILQNLFFATLNQEMDKRAFRRDGQNYNVTNLFRYKNFFKDEQKALSLFKDIPFLNGGLFECLDKPGENGKVERIDGFSDRDDNVLTVPNELFFGSEHEEDLSEEYGLTGKKYAEAKVKGLIKLLNSYVFTVTENTPVEEDVALDPELLGKVFENLLASYNPETKTTARKQTGSFYTPREIVNYMVDESLIAYLKNELLTEEEGYLEIGKEQGDIFGNSDRKGQLKIENKLDESPWTKKEAELDEKLHQLLSFDDIQPFTEDTTKTKLIEALDKCTILDPACGSGAFPMGVLQKMVHVLQKLDPQNQRWKERQLERARQIEDPDLQQKLIQDIEEAFESNELDYGRKLYLIENCIYGVDIQPIATQISKLRFFISLIVDQKVNDRKVNLGIRPLPNLETKFVAANTLVGLERPQQMVLRNPQIEKKEHELNEVRHRHFSAKTPKTKNKWRIRDKELREEIAKLLKNDGWGDKVAKQVADWDPYDQNKYSGFYDSEWMFGIEDGFSIVIGNPPYLRIQGILTFSNDFIDYVKQNYESATGRFDMYCLFTERAYKLTGQNGIVNFIMPSKWTNASFGKGLRKFISGNRSLLKLISFSEFQVFTASTYSSLIWLEKKTHVTFKYAVLDKDLNSETALRDWLKSLSSSHYTGIKANLGHSVWTLVQREFEEVFGLIKKQPQKLSAVVEGIFQGIVTGDNKVFVLEKKSNSGDLAICYSESLDSNIEIEDEILKPIIGGKQLNTFEKRESELFIVYPYHLDNTKTKVIDEGDFKIKFPKAYNYLYDQYTRLATRGSKNMKYPTWYSLWNARSINRLESPNKIITPDVCYHPQMWLDDFGYYHLDTSYSIVIKEDFEKYKYHLYSILNSSLTWFYLKNTGAVLRGGYFRFKSSYLENLPLPKFADAKLQVDIPKKLTTLIEIGKKQKNIAFYEHLYNINDAMVLQLYFPNHFKKLSIDLFVGLKEIFDKFESSESSIDKLKKELLSPDNQLRNDIKLLSTQSPTILKPILES